MEMIRENKLYCCRRGMGVTEVKRSIAMVRGVGVGGGWIFVSAQKPSSPGFPCKLWNNDMRGGSQRCSCAVQYVSSDPSRCAVA